MTKRLIVATAATLAMATSVAATSCTQPGDTGTLHTGAVRHSLPDGSTLFVFTADTRVLIKGRPHIVYATEAEAREAANFVAAAMGDAVAVTFPIQQGQTLIGWIGLGQRPQRCAERVGS